MSVLKQPETNVGGSNPKSAYVALTGNPNCGKTTLFNALTGLRAKVGNYAGVTVERKEGKLVGVQDGGARHSVRAGFRQPDVGAHGVTRPTCS